MDQSVLTIENGAVMTTRLTIYALINISGAITDWGILGGGGAG